MVNWALGNPDAAGDIVSAFQQGGYRRARESALMADPMTAEKTPGLALEDAMTFRNVRRQDTADQQAGQDRQAKASADAQAKNLETLSTAAKWLQGVPADQRDQAFEQLVPTLSAVMGPEHLELVRKAPKDDRSLMAFAGEVEKQKRHVLAAGSMLTDDSGKVLAQAPFAPEVMKFNDGGGESIAVVPRSAGAGQAGGAAGFDAIYSGFVAPQEGGFTANDGNGAPANFGINQKANPDIDVKNLTPERAKELYRERYWGPSGAENLPAPLQAVHFDTAVNMGVGAAQQLLQESRGDPGKYLELREQRYREIAGRDSSKPLDTWLRRNRQLGEFIGGGAPATGAQVVARGAPKPEKPADPPSGYRWNATGNLEAIPGGPAAKPGGGKGLPAQDRKDIASARGAAQQAQTLVADMERFVALNKRVPTGSNMVQRGLAHLGSAEYREMKSIQDKLTPAMRQGLPGAASDRDVAMFASAAPSVDKPGPTNQSIAAATKAFARRQADYVAYLEDFAKRNGTIVGAQEEWGVYNEANPLFGGTRDGGLRVMPQKPWRQWFGAPAPQAGRGQAPQRRDTRPARRMTDAELKAALGL